MTVSYVLTDMYKDDGPDIGEADCWVSNFNFGTGRFSEQTYVGKLKNVWKNFMNKIWN